MDLDQEISDIDQSEPFILVTGEVGTDNAQYFICIENALAFESKTFRDALVDVIASYYVFDIVYLKLNFLQESSCFSTLCLWTEGWRKTTTMPPEVDGERPKTVTICTLLLRVLIKFSINIIMFLT